MISSDTMFSLSWLPLFLCLACTPFSLPSIYLAQRLWRKGFMDTPFNQHVALMMVVSGE